MKEKLYDKPEKDFELNISEFYKELNKAISTNNRESIFRLSKIITRHQFKKMNN
ncbi:MAG: hypothetical protein ACW98X_09890 [Promethearchaeota archaeon]|jgi:hypothetical protein